MNLPLLAIGAIGGLFSGLFGVGGGFIMVPLLMVWARFDQRRASATSLLAIIPTALVSASLYGVGGQIDLVAAAIIAVGAIGGAPIGALLLRQLPLVWLKWIFIAGLAASAARFIIVAPERAGALDYSVGAIIGLLGLGLAMGIIAGLLGVGGGVIAVPVLIAVFGLGDLVAKGTSLLAMIPGAIAGTIPQVRRGVARIRDGVTVGLAAMVTSIAGVQLAFLIPPDVSGYLFAALMVAVGIQMALRPVTRPA